MKAIIFDFGNVIINIDLNKTYEAFGDLVFKSAEHVKKVFDQNQIFQKFETGLYNQEEFRDVIRQTLGYPLNDNEIDIAWNALLLDVPKNRIEYLEKLRLKYPIFLLSNTNEMHIDACKKYFRKSFGYSDFTSLFQKVFLSYQMGLYKPDYKIYQSVIDDLGLIPEDILFIDDNEDNIIAASELGIKTIKINPPECFTDILTNLFPDV